MEQPGVEHKTGERVEFNDLRLGLMHVAELLADYHATPYEFGAISYKLQPIYYRLFKTFGNSHWEWQAPAGKQIAIPPEIGEHYQVYQPEYESHTWIYPSLLDTNRLSWGPITEADSITADMDGIYAISGNARVVLFGPQDRYHNSGLALETISLTDKSELDPKTSAPA